MTHKNQLLIVVGIILVTLAITKFAVPSFTAHNANADALSVSGLPTDEAPKPEPAPVVQTVQQLPVRDMNIFDPEVKATSVLIKDLDLNFPYFSYHTETSWPIASVTKLMTAVIVSEHYGSTKNISISKKVLETEGIAGDLKAGEEYNSEDLMKIMLLTSSNRAAAAFEEYAGGREALTALMNKKAIELGMTHTLYVDGSGLSPKNVSTIGDLEILAKYLIDKHPEIISWTRLQSIKVQPTNKTVARDVNNIDVFSSQSNFLGGKTGTTPEARENLLALFTFNNDRVLYIILGSYDRVNETDKLFSWVKTAYSLSK